MQVDVGFWNLKESTNKSVEADPFKHIVNFASHH